MCKMVTGLCQAIHFYINVYYIMGTFISLSEFAVIFFTLHVVAKINHECKEFSRKKIIVLK